jgi:hypothetical protein
LDFGKLIEQQSADGVASDARRGGKRASWVGGRPTADVKLKMAQNCEYPQCGTPAGPGILRSIKNITGKGKSHVDVGCATGVKR